MEEVVFAILQQIRLQFSLRANLSCQPVNYIYWLLVASPPYHVPHLLLSMSLPLALRAQYIILLEVPSHIVSELRVHS